MCKFDEGGTKPTASEKLLLGSLDQLKANQSNKSAIVLLNANANECRYNSERTKALLYDAFQRLQTSGQLFSLAVNGKVSVAPLILPQCLPEPQMEAEFLKFRTIFNGNLTRNLNNITKGVDHFE